MLTQSSMNAYFSIPLSMSARYTLHERFHQAPGLAADLAALTDNTAGTASATEVAAMSGVDGTGSNAAPLAGVRNNFASVASRLSKLAINNRNFIVSGTNMTTALATFADGGGVTLTTAGASSDQAILGSNTNTKQSVWAAAKWNTNDRAAFMAVIKTGPSVANVTNWVGLKLTSTGAIATDDDQCYFRFNPSESSKWRAVTSRAGTDATPAEVGADVAADTTYELVVAIDYRRRPLFFVNGDLLYTGAALTADINLKPFVGVQADTGSAKSVTVRLLACAKD